MTKSGEPSEAPCSGGNWF